MRVFTKVDGKLACWQIDEDISPEEAIKLVRDELKLKHKPTILCLVKY